MGVSVEWAQAAHVTANMEINSKADLDKAEWTDSYGSEVTEDFALFMDNGSGLMVIEGSADELLALAEKIRQEVYAVHPGMTEPSRGHRMMEKRAGDLKVGDAYREIGDDTFHTISDLEFRGDMVLPEVVEPGGENAYYAGLDIDEVVQVWVDPHDSEDPDRTRDLSGEPIDSDPGDDEDDAYVDRPGGARGLDVPYPPTTEDQARAWVYWAESEIGVGWHPDTGSNNLVKDGGDPVFTGKRAKRYDEGLAAAHQLLPDIYATSMEILRDLHPEVVPT